MNNKQSAESFLQMVTAGKIREAYSAYVGTGFRHHNPYYKGDADSLMKGMEENEKQFPGKKFKIQHSVEEGDMVAVHSHVTLKPVEMEFATVHIFRFQDGKIAEIWDIAQQSPKDSPNENGTF